MTRKDMTKKFQVFLARENSNSCFVVLEPGMLTLHQSNIHYSVLTGRLRHYIIHSVSFLNKHIILVTSASSSFLGVTVDSQIRNPVVRAALCEKFPHLPVTLFVVPEVNRPTDVYSSILIGL